MCDECNTARALLIAPRARPRTPASPRIAAPSLGALLAAELASISASGGGALSEPALLRLDALLGGDGVLDRALEALDGGAVTRLRAPSGRVAWAVASSLSRRPAAEVAAADARASGLGDNFSYTVLLGGPGACTCADFAARVLAARADFGAPQRRACKHLLAAALAAALGRGARERAVGEDDLARLLASAFTAPEEAPA